MPTTIFPPSSAGGVPIGPSIVNGFAPTLPVVGGDPATWADQGCTTTLTASQMNALAAEILAAVDLLGFSFSTAKVTNLGEALQTLRTVPPGGGTTGQALVIDTAGNPVWGATLDAGNF